MRAMRRRNEWTLGLAAAFVCLCISASTAADGLAIVKDGNAAGAPACSSCHGIHGEGNLDSGYPRLAGMNAAYLVHQLNSLGDGSRDSEIMSPIARGLTSDERQAVADYFASQQTSVQADASGAEDDRFIRGRSIATTGLWEKGLPGCGECHGSHGQGVGEAFPPLSGQPAKYIEDELAAFADGKRHNDPMHLMSAIARKLSRDDAGAVAAYYGNAADASGKKESK